jgi:predicted O-methyltransferase YrrM
MQNLIYFERIQIYLEYYFKAKTVHHIHSPFISNLLNLVWDTDRIYYDFQKLQKIAEYLNTDTQMVPKNSFSDEHNQSGLSIEKLYRKTGHSRLDYERLYRLAMFLKPRQILELGTCTGMSSAALALGCKSSELITLEGNKFLSDYCSKLFKDFDIKNVQCIHCEFLRYLENTGLENTDLIFMDGHHQYDPTLTLTNIILENSKNTTIILLDDIHWSKGMYRAWKELINHPMVQCSLETLRWGFLFKDRRLNPANYCLIPQKYKPWSIGLFQTNG